MFFFGHYNIEQNEGSGRFRCPRCAGERDFAHKRMWSYFHVYFIPVAKQALVSEQIVCQQCQQIFPITVLADMAKKLASAMEAGSGDAQSLADYFGNVVDFTEAAIEEIKRRHAKGRFPGDVVVRVEPDRAAYRKVNIAFDLPEADGRDWIGQSHGIPIVIDRGIAPELQGSTIDFRAGEFVRM